MRTWSVMLFAAGLGLLGIDPARAEIVPPAGGSSSTLDFPADDITDLLPELAGGLNGLAGTPAATATPRESALFDGGLPLLGGLGGQRPANQVPATGERAATGLPPGGIVLRQPGRAFSDTPRPIAGVDRDFE